MLQTNHRQLHFKSLSHNESVRLRFFPLKKYLQKKKRHHSCYNYRTLFKKDFCEKCLAAIQADGYIVRIMRSFPTELSLA